ncbi:interferon a3-like [Hoplias malabaricus]|uniref:interferon a3-like n=1 Tax=Hoplias malabaricus TaxID=27720 RepID=UPI003461882F
MAALKLLSLVLVLLHVLDAAVVPCPWTHFRLRVLNEESIALLEKMGNLMPQKCLEEGGRTFPDEVFVNAQNEDVVVLALETLSGVDRIFKNQQTSVTWNREHLELFKNIISSRQVPHLQKCAGEAVSQRGEGSVAELKSYFEKLEETLKKKGFSECAWEKVRDEVHHGLSKFHQFLQKTTN